MAIKRQQFKNRNIVKTSGSSAATFSPPIGYVSVRAAGNVVMVDEAGNAVTFSSCKVGDRLAGPFSAFTSTTCSAIWLSDADPGVSAAETSIAGLFTNAQSAQAQVNIPLSGGILAAGTPMAAWANNSSSNPGITVADSKAYGLRWNNNSSQTAVWFGVALPQDLDDSAAIVIHALVSTVGGADSPTLTVTAFFQTTGALHDADTDCGGTSSAYTGGTTKQIQELTLSIAAGDVPASPCGLSLTVKPTNGTLDSDDCIITALWIEYTRKLLSA